MTAEALLRGLVFYSALGGPERLLIATDNAIETFSDVGPFFRLQYKDLIESQNGEQDGESIADQYKELVQSEVSDPNADTVKLPVRPVEEQIPNIIDELDL